MGTLITERERSNGQAQTLVTNTYIPSGSSITVDVKQSDGYNVATNTESITLTGGFGEENALSSFTEITDGYYWFEISTAGEIEIDKVALETTSDRLSIWQSGQDWDEGELLGSRSAIDGSSIDHEFSYGSLKEGLVAYYRFDESAGTTAKDSALDNDGEINGASYADGQIGTGLDFTSSNNQYVELNAELDKFEQFSVSFWVKFDDLTSDSGLVGKNHNDTWEIWLDNSAANSGRSDVITFIFSDSSGNRDRVESETSLNIDTWYYISCIHDGDSARIFLDGSLDGNKDNVVSPNATGSDPVTIANWNESYLDGQMDEVRIYERALSQGEITALYNLDKPSKITDRDRLSSGLKAHYPLNEESGSTAYDIVSSNDGSISGATLGQQGLMGSPSYSLDGTDGHISLGDISGISTGSPVTFSAWVNFDDTSGTQTIIEADSSSNTGLYYLYLSNGNLTMYRNDGTNTATAAGLSPTANKWYHIVGIHDGNGDLDLYINSVKNASASSNIGGSTDIADFNVGYRSFGNDWRLNASVQDVRIYNRALSISEIEELYKMGEVDLVTAPTNPEIVREGGVSFWPLNELDGESSVQDVWGSNSGTINGATPGYNGVGGQRAYQFNGSSDNIDTGYSQSNLNDFSVSGWVNISSGDGLPIITSDGTNDLQFGLRSGGFSFYTYDGTNAYGIVNGTDPIYDDWVHIVGIYNSNEGYKLFINGVLTDESSNTTLVSVSDTLKIGGESGNNLWSNGRISQVRIYNKVLTQQEVWRLYNQGRLLQGEIL